MSSAKKAVPTRWSAVVIEIERVRPILLDAYGRALSAAHPEEVTFSALERLDTPAPVTLCALGKAAPAMARAAHRALGSSITEAVIVSDHSEELPEGFQLILGSHPIPDERSVIGGTALIGAAQRAQPEGTLVVLVSGGGSALAEVPAGDLTIADIAATNTALILASVPIGEVNTVRRHLSLLKDGGLRRVSSAPTLTLCVSDVAGGPPSAIASGPTLPDGSTPADALAVLDRHDLLESVPVDVVRLLESAPDRGRDGQPHHVEVVADGGVAADAAAAACASQGLDAVVVIRTLSGDASSEASKLMGGAQPGIVSIAAGETTVAVGGSGSGGRNQHAALTVALAVEGTAAVFAALGTDGRDGPTDATGAIVDGGTAGRIREAGIDPAEALRSFDSHPALDAAGDLIRTGRTGTNVGDLWLAWQPEVR